MTGKKNSSNLNANNIKTTSYHNFMPTKAEEDEARANNREHQVGRTRVQIRELSPQPIILESNDPHNLRMPSQTKDFLPS
ncbi:hypothetical protein C1H46_007300 [Malus baccata]|uniref:Uncharacterized protein n=1 Tax=Malus baccata TaxID=106549 RepID=A0A540N7T2_MALBA|nr:hypothetical protein C1H46_007300 [Malus baccata]